MVDVLVNLFPQIPSDDAVDKSRPLADRMRPRTLDEFVGQEHILAPGKPLRVQIERDDTGSLLFWGPPGVGKTTLAKIIARMTHAEFIEFSAVLTGIKEIKQVMADAERARQYGTRTIVFVDEVHRFNKAQQDAFLPYVEKGSIRLIGATTENPSFEVISALLSRCRVYVLKPLTRGADCALTAARARRHGARFGRGCISKRTTMFCARLRPTPAETPAAPTTCWKSPRRSRPSSRRRARGLASPTPSSPTRCKSAC